MTQLSTEAKSLPQPNDTMDSTQPSYGDPSRTITPQTVGESMATSTLYPKITTHISEVIKNLTDLNRDPNDHEQDVKLDPIPIVGTVKLHGTHADILIYNDDRVVFQSRNIVGLQVAKDNAGFATTMSQKTKALLRLRDLLVARFTQLNPDVLLDHSQPVLIAGEWIGQSIQKDVAISQLSKRFVIISIAINGYWQRDSDYGGIALPNHDIYNISRAGTFHRTLHPSDPQRTITELSTLTEQIASQCPFAATFAITGAGEGIVWKPALAPHNSNPALWFKTKGGRFKPTFARAPRQSPERAEQSREVAARVAGIWTSEQRLEQGLEYMREHGIQRTKKGMGAFLKWVQSDIAVEERGYIAEQGVDAPMLRIEVAKIAKGWYVARLDG